MSRPRSHQSLLDDRTVRRLAAPPLPFNPSGRVVTPREAALGIRAAGNAVCCTPRDHLAEEAEADGIATLLAARAGLRTCGGVEADVVALRRPMAGAGAASSYGATIGSGIRPAEGTGTGKGRRALVGRRDTGCALAHLIEPTGWHAGGRWRWRRCRDTGAVLAHLIGPTGRHTGGRWRGRRCRDTAATLTGPTPAGRIRTAGPLRQRAAALALFPFLAGRTRLLLLGLGRLRGD